MSEGLWKLPKSVPESDGDVDRTVDDRSDGKVEEDDD